MTILLIGAGGREHALAWRIMREAPDTRLLALPSNPGITALGGIPLAVPVSDTAAMLDLAAREQVSLIVVGPEAPLAAGLVDAARIRGIPAFGPTHAAAQLETSKAFAKDVMRAASVPTARATMHTDVVSAQAAARALGAPVVVKASGLAAGKGVIIAQTIAEADDAIVSMLEGNAFGAAGAEVLIEEFMTGEELSLFVLTDGTTALPLPPAQDHKRIGEGDTGPNTGGMGAYCPADAGDMTYTWALGSRSVPAGISHVLDVIVHPTLREMRARGMPFTGLLYVGLMLTPTGPKVVEFNCRFGDPETQAVLPALSDDVSLLDVMHCIARGDALDAATVLPPARATVVTVIASAGYPDTPRTGDPITLPADDAIIFHAGTTLRDGVLRTSGGRVLGVTGIGESLTAAAAQSRDGAASVAFTGAYHRRDIGWRALARLR
jgi:phosphoribosylamine---glycine ligase